MEYVVMNREDARKESLHSIAPSTAIISITNVDDPPNRFGDFDWIKGIQSLKFNDVLAGRPNCMTEQDAHRVAEFVYGMYDRVERLLIHCEYGASRSAGVAAAIMKTMEGNDLQIWCNRRYAPNKTCYQMVLRALENTAHGRGKPYDRNNWRICHNKSIYRYP